MPTRRSPATPRPPLASTSLALLALVALIAACAAPTPPTGAARTVVLTSHTDGERVFGSRTITLAGTASNTSEVQVLIGGSVVTTVDVVGGAFQADVTLGDNANEVRVQTTDALVGDDVELVYPWVDATTFRPADVVIGQPDEVSNATSDASASNTSYGTPVYVEGILYVPDAVHNRILGYFGLPTEDGAAADFVLGQASFTADARNDDDQDGVPGAPTARTFFDPWEAWTDGDRLLVTDRSNHRVLLWATFPTGDFAPADVVIGQASMTTGAVGSGATGLAAAWTVASNGNQILVGDYQNARALVYDAFPTVNGVAADAVLGQGSFANTAPNDDDQDGVEDANPTARTLSSSYGAWMGEGVMVVSDAENNRFLAFVD